MIKALLVLLAATAFVVVSPQLASAHVLKTDGYIGAVLHIQPDDAPTSKTPVTYVLSFQSSKSGFSLENCSCSIAYILGDKTVAQAALAASSATVSKNNFTFEEAGVYTFKVVGSPKNGADFQPFTLNYVVRVGGGQADKRPLPMLLWVGMGMGVGLMLLATYASEYATNTNPKGKERGGDNKS